MSLSRPAMQTGMGMGMNPTLMQSNPGMGMSMGMQQPAWGMQQPMVGMQQSQMGMGMQQQMGMGMPQPMGGQPMYRMNPGAYGSGYQSGVMSYNQMSK